MFHPLLLPGIVQTEEYARAVLRAGRPTNLDDLVTARMERQRILERENPTRLWLVLNEGVLRNTVGDAAVMSKQLRRLHELARCPPPIVQILPTKGNNHVVASPFGSAVLQRGRRHRSCGRVSTRLPSMAAPPDESADMIDSISKDCYS